VPVPPVPPVPPMPGMPGMPGADLSDLDVSVDLGDLQLTQPQRDQLQQILSQEQQASDQAEQTINGLSDGLRTMLQDPNASETDVQRMVDQINSAEGSYRKARIVAWMRARKVLDQQQQDALMSATHHHHRHHH
jgi:ABC-type transporter Mla subunit MlaD